MHLENQEQKTDSLSVRVCRIPGLPRVRIPVLAVFGTLQRNLAMAAAAEVADIVHCHTWYTHWAGCLIKQLTGAKLLLTTHSLEAAQALEGRAAGACISRKFLG